MRNFIPSSCIRGNSAQRAMRHGSNLKIGFDNKGARIMGDMASSEYATTDAGSPSADTG